jgi:hypothetical protein
MRFLFGCFVFLWRYWVTREIHLNDGNLGPGGLYYEAERFIVDVSLAFDR